MKNKYLILLALLLLNLSATAENIKDVKEHPTKKELRQKLLQNLGPDDKSQALRRKSVKEMSTGVSKAQEALKQDPFSDNSVWDQEFLKRDTEMANSIKKYQENQYAKKSKTLVLAKLTKDDIVSKLLSEGFVKIDGRKKLDTSQNEIDAKSAEDKVPGEIYTHSDGSMVRLKDAYASRKYRPQAYVTKSALKDPNGSTSWDNEAFKVTNDGYAVPKSPYQKYGMKIHSPASSGNDEDQGWVDLIMEEAHADIVSK